MNPVIEFQFVVKRNDFILDVEGCINNGITGLFGPSGSGKTTFLHSLAGLIKPISGKIRLNDKTIFDKESRIFVSSKDRGIGYVFQDSLLFPHLSVEQNLKYGITKSNSEIPFEEIVDILEIGDLLNKKPSSCSGGEKQRIAIGRAILRSPDILLMDEPFSAFELRLRGNIIPYLNRINRKYGIPILVISHDLPDLMKLANTLIIVSAGKILGQGSYQSLILNEKCSDTLYNAGLTNVFKSEVIADNNKYNNSIVHLKIGNIVLNASCDKELVEHFAGSILNVSIRPQDISISLNHVSNISIQNQIPGVIKQFLDYPNHLLCIVDVGFILIVEVTKNSAKELNLEKDMNIFCLFKSVSMKVEIS